MACRRSNGVRQGPLSKPSSDRRIHLIGRLYIIELRLQERGPRLELLCDRRLCLRPKRAALRKKICRHAPRLGAQGKQVLRRPQSPAGFVHLVVGGLHAQFDFVRHPRKVLVGLFELNCALRTIARSRPPSNRSTLAR